MLVAEFPEGFLGGGFGGGVEDGVFGFVAEGLGDGLGPVVPVFFGGFVAFAVGVADGGGEGGGHDEGFHLGAGVVEGGGEDAEVAVDGGGDEVVPGFELVVEGGGGVDDCGDAWAGVSFDGRGLDGRGLDGFRDGAYLLLLRRKLRVRSCRVLLPFGHDLRTRCTPRSIVLRCLAWISRCRGYCSLA